MKFKTLSKGMVYVALLGGMSATPAVLKAELRWSAQQGWHASGGLASLWDAQDPATRTGIQLMNQAKQHEQAAQDRQAINCYRRVYQEYAQSELAPEALIQEARLRTQRREYSVAFKRYDTVLKQYPDYPGFNAVVRYQFDVACLLMEGKRPYYWGVLPGLKDYDGAIRYFDQVVRRAPFGDLAPRALWNMALVARQHGKPEQVVDTLERLIYGYPDSELAPGGFLLLAKTYADWVSSPLHDQAPTRQALAVYEEFLVRYPQHPDVAEAEARIQTLLETLAQSRHAIGDFYYKYRNNPKAAAVFYSDAVRTAPDTPVADAARHDLQNIKNRVPPPKTWVDVVFGRYERAQSQETLL